MGRPLNKKYFGNRNIGSTSTTADDGIGGQGIDSINWSTLGSFLGNSNVAVLTVPNLPAPTLPTGVQATWSVLFEVESVTTGAGKTDLAVGDTFGIASVPGLIAKVTNLSGANAIFSVTTTGASRGTPLAVGDLPQDSQTVTMTKIAGTGTAATFVVDIFFRVASVTITEQGSGYVGTETFTFTKPGTTSGTIPAGTIVLTTDTGAVGSATNEENAIRCYAFVTGGSRKVGDIIKQVSTDRYKVKTADGEMICQLVTDGVANAAGEMDITAYDSGAGGSNEYWVKKLTGRRATLVVKGDGTGGSEFATNSSAPWSFDAASTGYVQIDNA